MDDFTRVSVFPWVWRTHGTWMALQAVRTFQQRRVTAAKAGDPGSAWSHFLEFAFKTWWGAEGHYAPDQGLGCHLVIFVFTLSSLIGTYHVSFLSSIVMDSHLSYSPVSNQDNCVSLRHQSRLSASRGINHLTCTSHLEEPRCTCPTESLLLPDR